MFKVLTRSSFDQLNTLDEKLEYVKQLNKNAEFEEALFYYKQLRVEFEKNESHENVMACLSGICQSLGNLGRVNEIKHYLEEYRLYCEKHGDDLSKLKLYSLVGYMNNSIEDYEAAAQSYEAALEIASKLEDIQRTTYILINLQSAYIDLGELGKALKCSAHLKQIYKEDRQAFSTLSYCAYLLNYMTILIEQEEIDDIPSLMAELEQVSGFEKLKREQMYSALLKGRYYELKNIPAKAIQYYEEAYSYLKITKESPYYKRVLKYLIQQYKTLCQFEKAVEYSDELTQYLENMERHNLQYETIKLSKKLKIDEMQTLIYIDTLTGIHNRRFLEIQGTTWVELANAQKQSLACAIIDMDNFKQINDTYGHMFGDEVLKYFASNLANQMETDMMCVRYGGDEFIILARFKDDYSAIFQQLFAKISDFAIERDGHVIPVDASMGVKIVEADMETTLKELIGLADQALYRSKDFGKDRITFA